jgi:hypothetical protein
VVNGLDTGKWYNFGFILGAMIASGGGKGGSIRVNTQESE